MEPTKVPSQNKRARQVSLPSDDQVTSAESNGDSLAKKPREQIKSTESWCETVSSDISLEQGSSSASSLPQSTSQTSASSVPSALGLAPSAADPAPSAVDPVLSGSPADPAVPAVVPDTTVDHALSDPALPPVDPVPVDPDENSRCRSKSGSLSRSASSTCASRDGGATSPLPLNDDSNIGNESDSDLDYDDLDDIVVPSDVDDFMDDVDDSVEDDHSVASSTTTLSTGSVGSNTPSVVGESLESVSLGEGKRKAANWTSVAPNLTDSPALRRSLFSNIPPTINFMLHNETSAHQLPDDIRRLLKWRLSTITPLIVKRCAGNSGFRLMRKTCVEWNATWGKHMKSVQFKEIKENQKINHFPGTFNIGRKDRLWRNYHRLMLKFGKAEFGFLPRTFVLPADTKLLKKVWERRGGRGRWIIKPPALARGVGITVVNKFSKIPKNKPLVVQRYVARPYLINGTKFDLRLYLLVTSINPLRMYLYDDGLVRFASNKYSNDSKCVNDVYMHLTNYSINKNSSTYTQNDDSESCQGHKWTLKSLWRHFDALGIDHTVVWDKVKDLMIKTVISAENSMANLFQQNVGSRYSCFELFGFDILLDSKLKPWLIEVNISPSLHSTSSLDLDVKSPLATEVFNMARYHIPNKVKAAEQRQLAEKLGYENLHQLCQERRLYVKEISKGERAKHDSAIQTFNASKSSVPPESILNHLTPDDTRQLVVAEDELATSRRFQRIFPTNDTHRYFKYFEKPRYYNLLLSAWEQRYSGLNRDVGRKLLEDLCLAKHHLKVPATVYVKKTSSGQQAIDISGLAAPSSELDKKTEQTATQPTADAGTASAPNPSTNKNKEDAKHNLHDQTLRVEESRRLSSGSEMDCGSVTPSPRGTPEHPGTAEFLAGNSGFSEILAGNAGTNKNLSENDNAQVDDNRKPATTTPAVAVINTEQTGVDSSGELDNRPTNNYNLIMDH